MVENNANRENEYEKILPKTNIINSHTLIIESQFHLKEALEMKYNKGVSNLYITA